VKDLTVMAAMQPIAINVMLNEVKDLAVTFRSSLCFAEEAELHSA
jgi:hypothetical protein